MKSKQGVGIEENFFFGGGGLYRTSKGALTEKISSMHKNLEKNQTFFRGRSRISAEPDLHGLSLECYAALVYYSVPID